MRLLLDSHIVVWWLANSPRLPAKARSAISDPANEALVSAASAWELVLKVARGKLRLPPHFMDRLRSDGFRELAVTPGHAIGVARLPPHHADPFDRMLISQALAEGLVLVTCDSAIQRYAVPLFENEGGQ
jgi:PIN domain nuclease of toxin-antitoxin system